MSQLPGDQYSTSEEWLEDYISYEPFKQSEDQLIRVLLYEDEFEIANPLGSAKEDFKLLGVYLTLGRLPLHCRSRVEAMQVVLLCRQKDVKEFGLTKVLQPLIEDLVDLERSGVVISGARHDVRLDFMMGDNLGSYSIGGFSRNFSTSTYFCRVCLVTRSEFEEDPLATREIRIPQHYDECLKRVAESCSTSSDCGIVEKSPFHALKFFMYNSGLPPGIAHDLLEGVIKHDVSLYIQYFLNKKNVGSHMIT